MRVLLALVLAIGAWADASVQARQWTFVRRAADGRLLENGRPFKFVSYNVPAMLLIEDRPRFVDGFPLCKKPVHESETTESGIEVGKEEGRTCAIPYGENAWEFQIPTPWEQEDAIRTVVGSGGRVIRTYTLAFGPHYHVTSPRKYYEPAMVAMDHALALARKYGIRLIVPFINNNWKDDEEMNIGEVGWMARFRGKHRSEFYSNSQIRQDFKNLISDVLNRVNTVNGIRYGDDPTILAWQLGNELGGWEGTPPSGDWIVSNAKHIKSLAPNTLVMDGTMGGLRATQRFSREALASPYVDIFSNHYYGGDGDLRLIDIDSKFVTDYKKAFIIGEFGLTSPHIIESILKRTVSSHRITGALLWSLRFHSEHGGFYTHFEKDQYWAYHVPGFPSWEENGFTPNEKTISNMMRQYGLMAQGLSAARHHPIPPPPRNIPGLKPSSLRWGGSAWAAKYALWRWDFGDWEFLSMDIQDGVPYMTTLYSDKEARRGVYYWYYVAPISVDGIIGDGTIIGPYKE